MSAPPASRSSREPPLLPLEGEGEAPAALRPILRGAASLYRAALGVRRAVYASGLVNAARVSRPVISVGNLVVGGTGKTPFTILLARRLVAAGQRPAVVSRGYGRTGGGAGPKVIEPAFERFPDAREVGDEPILIALRAGVPVMVSADRALGAAHAIERLGATVILLDDGFQHWRLARDLDIALLDAERPLGNGRLLPAGPLREPSESLRRAGLVVAVHGPGSPAHVAVASLLAELGAAAPPRIDVEVVPTSVGPLAPRRPAVARDTARVVPGAAEEAGRLGPEGAVDTPDLALSGRRVALIAAIARPERFSRTVASLGAAVVHETFLRDHAVIGSEALARFREGAARAGADLLLTTEKDAVRLGSSAPSDLSVLAIEHRIITGAGVLDRKLSEVAVVDAAEERPSEIAHG